MPYTIHLHVDFFVASMRSRGFSSDASVARAMEVNRSTVTRVLAGELRPGRAFIGGALTALAPLTFDDLFTVVKVPRDASDPGRRRTATRHPKPDRERPRSAS
ncbi:transcriptional regulator [Saccharothrix lopnurensis]|uniref:Transcriptional regulator n=1 Tax=Saccharothrix lopnurensis TaxID=1670621 RepID=A0ABW1PFP3_9PSEU